MERGCWSDLAQAGAEIALRVTPRARRNVITREETAAGPAFRAQVTAPPEDGRANAAVQALLAQALGLAKSRIVLVRGATARDKVFRIL